MNTSFAFFDGRLFFDSPSMVDPRKRTKIGKYGGQGRVVRKRKSKRILDKKSYEKFRSRVLLVYSQFFPKYLIPY